MSIMGLRRSTGGRYLRVISQLRWVIYNGFWDDTLRWLDAGTWNDGV